MQFLSEKFMFDGITSDEMNVELITFDNDIIRDFGNIYKQDMNSEGNLNNNPFYSESFSDIDDTVLNIALIDLTTGNTKQWTDSDLQRVSNWLITKTFKPFTSGDNEDVVYYFKCTNINKRLSSNSMGYLECTFKMFGNYAYERFETSFAVDGSRSISIQNTSNIDSNYKPIIKITNLGDKNTSNSIRLRDRELLISGIENNETLTIDNKMCTVLDSSNKNRIVNVNRKWIGLEFGKNEITVKGKCKVEILSEFPIVM